MNLDTDLLWHVLRSYFPRGEYIVFASLNVNLEQRDIYMPEFNHCLFERHPVIWICCHALFIARALFHESIGAGMRMHIGHHS